MLKNSFSFFIFHNTFCIFSHFRMDMDHFFQPSVILFATIIEKSKISDMIDNDDLFKILYVLSLRNVEDVCKIYDTLVKRKVITNTIAGKSLIDLVTEPDKNGVENEKSFYDQIKTLKNSLTILSYIHLPL